MKKPLLVIVLLFVIVTMGWSQNSKFSPITRQLLHEITIAQEKYGNLNSLADKMPTNARTSVMPSTGALAKVSHEIDISRLQELGVKVHTKAGNIWSLNIPLDKLSAMADVKGLEYLETDFAIQPRLEESRQLSRVDQVHQAINGLSTSYTGDGVVLGIIDYDFVLNHPAFYSEDGSQYRVSKVWLQSGFTGTPPAPYDYGAELSGANEILNLGVYSTSSGSHGTHVAGIAGGSGNGSNGAYRGFAPEAELVFVELSSFDTSPSAGISGPSAVIDAVNYIFEYAASQNKPAVINMSLGTHIGPHDGTSLLEQGLDNLAGAGKILVAAAGNEGDTPLHVSHTFNSEETMATAIIGQNVDDGIYASELSVWGSANTNFEVNVLSYNAFTGEINETGFISTQTDNEQTIGSEEAFENGEIDFVASLFAGPSSTGNNRPNAYIRVGYTENFDQSSWVIALVRAENGTVHIWNNGFGSGAELTDAASGDVDPSFDVVWKGGNSQYTVGEFGTAREVITVGAYNTSAGGTTGEIASFSSRGPTLDMRVKPDIVAPGNRIISAYNDQDEEFTDRSDVVSTTSGNDGLDYIFAYSQGTSMAAPAVAGAIALMLEAKPDLRHEHVLAVFEETASEDNFVSLEAVDDMGNPKSNTWGYGKMDVLDAMLAIEAALGPAPSTNLTLTGFTIQNSTGSSTIVSGNPAFGIITIQNTGTTQLNQTLQVEFTSGSITLPHSIALNLAPGASITENVPFGNVEVVGNYNVTATIDPANQIEESNEADNSLSASYTVIAAATPLPNLVPQALTIVNENGETPLAVGGQAFFVVTFQNTGDADITQPFTINYDVNGEIFFSTVTDIIAAGQSHEEVVEVGSPTEPGSLTVIATLDAENVIEESDENDNSITATVSIIDPNVAPDPITGSITASLSEAEIDEEIVFEVIASGGIPPYNYDWSFNIAGLVLDEVDNAITVAFEEAGDVEVTVTITDAEGNAETIVITNLASILEIVNSADEDIRSILNYYPNPSAGSFSINFKDHTLLNQLKQIRIFNVQGMEIDHKLDMNQDGLLVDISQTNAGVYIVYLQFDQDWKSFRLIRN